MSKMAPPPAAAAAVPLALYKSGRTRLKIRGTKNFSKFFAGTDLEGSRMYFTVKDSGASTESGPDVSVYTRSRAGRSAFDTGKIFQRLG